MQGSVEKHGLVHTYCVDGSFKARQACLGWRRGQRGDDVSRPGLPTTIQGENPDPSGFSEARACSLISCLLGGDGNPPQPKQQQAQALGLALS